jgi:hypothetical protein
VDRESRSDQRRTDGSFEPVAVVSRRAPLRRWVVLALLTLVLAIAKPWASADRPVGVGGGSGLPAAAASAEPTPATTGLATALPDRAGDTSDRSCLELRVWLATSVEHDQGRSIRVWRAVEPATAASGPDDASIPTIPIVSDGASAIGWCAPSYGVERPVDGPAPEIDMWRITDLGPVLLHLTRWPSGTVSSDDAWFGSLYGSPDVSPAAPPTASPTAVAPGASHLASDPDAPIWPDGRYVLRYRQAARVERWFAMEVITYRLIAP